MPHAPTRLAENDKSWWLREHLDPSYGLKCVPQKESCSPPQVPANVTLFANGAPADALQLRQSSEGHKSNLPGVLTQKGTWTWRQHTHRQATVKTRTKERTHMPSKGPPRPEARGGKRVPLQGSGGHGPTDSRLPASRTTGGTVPLWSLVMASPGPRATLGGAGLAHLP